MPSRHRTTSPARLTAFGAVAALVLSLLAAFAGTTASARVAPDGDAKQVTASSSQRRAVSALDRVRSVFDSRQAGRRIDATMALRDLANTRTALTGADRAAAEALLARPTDPEGDGNLDYGAVPEAPPLCDTDICVHYVTSGPHAVDLTDLSPVNGIPDYVETAAATLDDVHDNFLAAGYREPKPDGTFGGNDLIDIYLGNIGVNGLYGYCTSDQPEPDPTPSTYDRWAYCVLDNDYSASEFPTNTPLENLQVTVAHEYFHAVQYAYDRYEDAWLLEATAAWVEDELYDGVDDNLQYLASSQMRSPKTPLDTFGNSFHYGTWSFFRFLSEKFKEKKGPLPRIVLDIYQRADGAAGGRDEYSWQAVDKVLQGKRTSGAAMLGAYAVANRRPGKAYAEGNKYPTAPLVGSLNITARKGAKAALKLDHLATATGKLVPKGLSSKSWKLKLTFNMTPKSTGSLALVTTTPRSGKVSTVKIALDKSGDAVKRIPFSSSKVANVEVTLVNGSGRFACFRSPGNYSCSGNPKDDNLVQKFTAFAVR